MIQFSNEKIGEIERSNGELIEIRRANCLLCGVIERENRYDLAFYLADKEHAWNVIQDKELCESLSTDLAKVTLYNNCRDKIKLATFFNWLGVTIELQGKPKK